MVITRSIRVDSFDIYCFEKYDFIVMTDTSHYLIYLSIFLKLMKTIILFIIFYVSIRIIRLFINIIILNITFFFV